jgi:hypothetical protein
MEINQLSEMNPNSIFKFTTSSVGSTLCRYFLWRDLLR